MWNLMQKLFFDVKESCFIYFYSAIIFNSAEKADCAIICIHKNEVKLIFFFNSFISAYSTTCHPSKCASS